jgi:hypothetical protein
VKQLVDDAVQDAEGEADGEGRRVLLTDVPGLRRRAHQPPETVNPPGAPLRR